MKFFNTVIILLVITILAENGQSFSAWQSVAGGDGSQLPVPRFEPADCPIPLPKDEKAVCGYLVVRESRAVKNEKTIRLPIAILKSDVPNPKPDPVMRTLGGPGASSMRMVTGRRFSPWLRDRDMIIFEQRGTKYAQPSLECPEVDEANINSVRQSLKASHALRDEVRAAKTCHDRLIKAGVNLSAYNSKESAADIEDLRRVLKIEKINLYGVSYSSRLMLEVSRDYPAGVRSIVIESVIPAEVNYDEVAVDAIARAFDHFFEKCAADTVCSKGYPKLEENFYSLVKRTNVTPIKITINDTATGKAVPVAVDGNDIISWFADYYLSSDGGAITSAPQKIWQLTQGDYTPLHDYAASKLTPGFYSLGMRYSVWCGEEIPFEDKDRIGAQLRSHPKLSGYETHHLPAICHVWKVKRAEKIENVPIRSSVPALILGAEFDSYTPPAWGRQTAANLKNSFYFEVPWAGHGPGFNSPKCLADMVAGFLDDPASPPKSDCLGNIERHFKFLAKPSPLSFR